MMKEKYELVANLDSVTKKIYEKYFRLNKYTFLINEERLLFVKKGFIKVNQEDELKIMIVIKNMINAYKCDKIIYVNLTNEVREILNKMENNSNIKCVDHIITFPIRKVIINSIRNKYGKINNEIELNDIK